MDGCVSIREGKSYEIIIADRNRDYLLMLCKKLRELVNVSCKVYSSSRDKAFRLRIYGKDFVYKVVEIQNKLLTKPNKTLLAAAIDAEGNVKQYRNQPFRTRIVIKNNEKALAIEKALKKLGIKYLKHIHCRAKNQCNYLVFIISGKEENKKLYSKIKILHPDKIREIKNKLRT